MPLSLLNEMSSHKSNQRKQIQWTDKIKNTQVISKQWFPCSHMATFTAAGLYMYVKKVMINNKKLVLSILLPLQSQLCQGFCSYCDKRKQVDHFSSDHA